MDFGITCDANYDSGISRVQTLLSRAGIFHIFDQKNYGESLLKIFIVMMCRDPELTFQQRIRFSKKDQTLYIDIMFDLLEMAQMDREERPRFVAKKLLADVPPIIAKYKFPDFDLPRFEKDLRSFFKKQGWLSPAPKKDPSSKEEHERATRWAEIIKRDEAQNAVLSERILIGWDFEVIALADCQTGIGKAVDLLTIAGIRVELSMSKYGESVAKMEVFLVCVPPESDYKPRIAFTKKDRLMHIEIGFGFPEMVAMSDEERQKTIARKLLAEVPPIIAKYKLPDFDLSLFEFDLKAFLKRLGWV